MEGMTTVQVAGYGQASASVGMMSRFEGMKKTELVSKIAEWTKSGSGKQGVAFWRALPKETLVIVAADMFATDLERAGQAAADAEPSKANAAMDAVKFTETSQDTHIPASDSVSQREAELIEAPNGYRLRCTVLDGWLRRDQPRKPGDKPTWKRVSEPGRASVYKSLRQAQAKLTEVFALYDDRDHRAELEVIK